MNTTPLNAWILDADGVITDINTHKANPSVLQAIIALLTKGEPVAIVTGRSLVWVKEEVITPLAALAQNNTIFDNVFVSAEFGGTHLEYRMSAEIIKNERNLVTPPDIKTAANEIFRGFSNSMFAEEKKVILSFACKPGFPLDKFHGDQKIFADKLRKMLTEYGQDGEFVVHTDMLGTNIKHVKLNKQFATAEVLMWVDLKHINPLRYNAIGDSQSDTEMGHELFAKNKNFEFVFVNDDAKLDRSKIQYPVIVTTKKFTEGTLEFINSTLTHNQL